MSAHTPNHDPRATRNTAQSVSATPDALTPEDRALHDLELITGVQSGDRAALSALYTIHGPILLGVGTKMLNSREAAEDVLHDVFVEVWKKAHTYRKDRGSVRAWILMRMRSRCLDRIKSGWNRHMQTGTVPTDEREERGQVVLDTIDAKRAKAALQHLPEPQRRVLELGYFKGFSSTEIAETLDIPVGTVKSRARLGLAALRTSLGVSR